MDFIKCLLRGENNPCTGYYEFKSSDHIRYQNGIDVSGHNYNCNRIIKFEKNISGNEGYTITIFNQDNIHPFWGNNVQMAPKQMKVISCNYNSVVLVGFGFDHLGNPFNNYGITIEHHDGDIVNCTLHMYDKSVDLKYFI